MPLTIVQNWLTLRLFHSNDFNGVSSCVGDGFPVVFALFTIYPNKTRSYVYLSFRFSLCFCKMLSARFYRKKKKKLIEKKTTTKNVKKDTLSVHATTLSAGSDLLNRSLARTLSSSHKTLLSMKFIY